MKVEKIIRLLKLNQMKKQIIVFLPLLSLGNSIKSANVKDLIIISLIFSFVTFSVYIFNDLCDFSEDRLHPYKKNRPIASESLTKQNAYFLLYTFLLLSLILLITSKFKNKNDIGILILVYLVINILYSRFKLKNINLVGVILVASGFPIRFTLGTMTLNLKFSYWGFTLIFLLAFFLLAGKRLQNFLMKSEKSNNSIYFWISTLLISVATFVSLYIAFISDEQIRAHWGINALLLSVIPMILGLIRYVEIVFVQRINQSRDVTDAFIFDYFILICGISFFLILFMGRLSVT